MYYSTRRLDLEISFQSAREFGSGGTDIVRKLAERLGWKLWDQLLINEIARSWNAQAWRLSSMKSTWIRSTTGCSKLFIWGIFEESLNAPRMKMVDTECIREVAERVVTAAAKGRARGHCRPWLSILPQGPAGRFSRLG
jgi:hypothetical protein